MHRVVAPILVLAAAVPASVVHQYQLKHPRREHCRAHYTRKLETVKHHTHGKTTKVRETFCVYVPPKAAVPVAPAPAAPAQPTPEQPAAAPALIATTTHVSQTPGPELATRLISASISYFTGTEIHELRGEPVTYTITDRTTEHIVGTFTGTSNGYASCAIGFWRESTETTLVYKGEAVTPYSACSLAPVSVPAADIAVITASFAGNASYGASASSQEAL